MEDYRELVDIKYEAGIITLGFRDGSGIAPFRVSGTMLFQMAMCAINNLDDQRKTRAIAVLTGKPESASERPVVPYVVKAYANPFDGSPEAIFEVNARSEEEAQYFVERDPASTHYRKFAFETGQAGVVNFSPVAKS